MGSAVLEWNPSGYQSAHAKIISYGMRTLAVGVVMLAEGAGHLSGSWPSYGDHARGGMRCFWSADPPYISTQSI